MEDSTDKMDISDSTLLEDPGGPHAFHNSEPDFTRPLLEIPPEDRKTDLGSPELPFTGNPWPMPTCLNLNGYSMSTTPIRPRH